MENKKLLEEIRSYWNNRADGYSRVNQEELHSEQKEKWKEVLLEQLPKKEKDQVKILDIGTGPGFFAILLAEEGYQVTAVDYTEQMLQEAKSNAADLADQISFKRMDAQNLEFEDDVFDVVISRNLTWNLKDPKRAYEEWCRVLKPGGVMINLDANYGAADFADTADLPENHAHHQIQDELMQECEDIKRQLPISSFLRPAWDLETLSRIGVEEFSFDLGISKRIYTEKDEFYNPTPMFLIFAKKQR